MIDRDVFNERRDTFCRQCEWWQGVCLKGHALGSSDGCPLHKFPPVEGAGYAPDKQAEQDSPKLIKGCCGGSDDMPPLTWAQVLIQFTKSIATWIAEGLPLVSSEQHGARYEQCKPCPQFKRFYCKHCKCIAYLKTKLGTEVCPLDPPRWT
jgi:hypothetical protein